MENTTNDGKTYQTKYYDLDAIIAVGYRVNSMKATQFRIWGTKTLKEYITKGLVLVDELLKKKVADLWPGLVLLEPLCYTPKVR